MSVSQFVSCAEPGRRRRQVNDRAAGSAGGRMGADEQSSGRLVESLAEKSGLRAKQEGLVGTAVDDRFMEVDNDTVHSQSHRVMNGKTREGQRRDGSPLGAHEDQELDRSGQLGREYFLNVDEELGSAHPGSSQMAEGRRQDSGLQSALVSRKAGSGRMYESPSRESLPSSVKFEGLSAEEARNNRAAPGQPRPGAADLRDRLASEIQHHRPHSFALSSQDGLLEAVADQAREKDTLGAAQATPAQASKVHIIKKTSILFQSGQDEPLRKALEQHKENSTKPKKDGPLEEFEDLQKARGKRRSAMNVAQEQEREARSFSSGGTGRLAPTAISKMLAEPKSSKENLRNQSSDGRYVQSGKESGAAEDGQEQRRGWISKEEQAIGMITRRGLEEMSQSQQSDDMGGCTMQSKSENSSLTGQSSDDAATSRKGFCNHSAEPSDLRKADEVEARISVQNFVEADAPFLEKADAKQSLKHQAKRCQNLERYQRHMQLNTLYEKFSPLQEFYKGLAPSKNAGKAAAGERIPLQARQHAKNSHSGLKPEGPPRLTAGSGLENHAAVGPLEAQKGQTGPNSAQTAMSFYPVSSGQAARRLRPAAEKQADRNSVSKANTLARDLKKSRKQEVSGQDKKRNQLSKKSNAEFKSMEAQSQNDVDTSSQQVNLDESNARCNSTEGCPDDSQMMQDDGDYNGHDKDLGKIDKASKSKQKIKIIKMRQKKLVINISMCKYPIVRKIAKYEFNFFLSARDMFAPVNGQIVLDQQATGGTSYVTNGLARDPDDDYFDIYWMDGSGQKHMDRFSQLKSHQRINHFPGMSLICRKNELGKLLNAMLAKYGEQFDFYPRTWVLPRDLRAFEAYVEQKRNIGGNSMQALRRRGSTQSEEPDKDKIFIVKPEAACQGRGIFLARDVKDIENYNQGYQSGTGEGPRGAAGQATSAYEHFHCVVQEYIDSPLLIDRMKFDLRLYVLVLGVDPLRIFLFKDGLARLATSAYSKPTEYNMCNMQMHLTNYAINKNSMGFMKNYTAMADFVGSKRSLKFVLRYLKKHFNADTGKLVCEIKDLIIKTILSAQPHLAHQYRSYQLDDYENSMCFEILGFDIMLNDKFKPYLLEVNHAPSFATDSPLDEKIKGQVVYDTLNLLGLSQKRKRNYKIANKMRVDLRRMSTKKANLPLALREQLRKDFDELRNQYEFRNKGMYDMIYPILDEITLDPVEDRMRPYLAIQQWATREYCKKNHIKPPVPLQKLKKQETQQAQEQKQRRAPGGSAWGKGGSQGFGSAGQQSTEASQKLRPNYKNVKSRVFDDVNGKNKNKSNQLLLEEQVNQSSSDKQDHKLSQLTQFLLSGAQDQLTSSQLQERLRLIQHQILHVPATMSHLNELLQCDQQLRLHCGGGPSANAQYSQQIQKSKDELRQLIMKLSEDLKASSGVPAHGRGGGRLTAVTESAAVRTGLTREQRVIAESAEEVVGQAGDYRRGSEARRASVGVHPSMPQPPLRNGNVGLSNARPASQLSIDNAAASFERVLNSELTGLAQSRMGVGSHECMTYAGHARGNANNLDHRPRTFLAERRPSAASSKPSVVSGSGVPVTYQNASREKGGAPILIKSIHLAPNQLHNHGRGRETPRRTGNGGGAARHSLLTPATAKEQLVTAPSSADQMLPRQGAWNPGGQASLEPKALNPAPAEQARPGVAQTSYTVSRMQKMQTLQNHQTESELRDPRSASSAEALGGPAKSPGRYGQKERQNDGGRSGRAAASLDQSEAKTEDVGRTDPKTATRNRLEQQKEMRDKRIRPPSSGIMLTQGERTESRRPASQLEGQEVQVHQGQLQPKRAPQVRRLGTMALARPPTVEVSFDEMRGSQGERGKATVFLLESQPQHATLQHTSGRSPLKLKLVHEPNPTVRPPERAPAKGPITAGSSPTKVEARPGPHTWVLQQASPGQQSLRSLPKPPVAAAPAGFQVTRAPFPRPQLPGHQPPPAMLPAPPLFRVLNAPEATANSHFKLSTAGLSSSKSATPLKPHPSFVSVQQNSHSKLLVQPPPQMTGAASYVQGQLLQSRIAGRCPPAQGQTGKVEGGTSGGRDGQGIPPAHASPTAPFLQLQHKPTSSFTIKTALKGQQQPPTAGVRPKPLPQRTIHIASGLQAPLQPPLAAPPSTGTGAIAKQLSTDALNQRPAGGPPQSPMKPQPSSTSKPKQHRVRSSLGTNGVVGDHNDRSRQMAKVATTSGGTKKKQQLKRSRKGKDGGTQATTPLKITGMVEPPGRRPSAVETQLRRQLIREIRDNAK